AHVEVAGDGPPLERLAFDDDPGLAVAVHLGRGFGERRVLEGEAPGGPADALGCVDRRAARLALVWDHQLLVGVQRPGAGPVVLLHAHAAFDQGDLYGVAAVPDIELVADG